MTPVFLEVTDVLEIHRQLIERFGGSHGLRDRGLLESSLATPQSMFGGQYLHEFPHEMAAAYLFHLVKNHPFIDGNKRIGATAARVFLLINGMAFDPTEQEYGDLTLAIASGQADKAVAFTFFKTHVRPS